MYCSRTRSNRLDVKVITRHRTMVVRYVEWVGVEEDGSCLCGAGRSLWAKGRNLIKPFNT